MGNNILFVDDEENILKLMKRTFFNSRYNIFLASSAEEGLEIIKRIKIDIAVSDVRMAKIDGFLFFEMMKDISPETFRIVLSGFVDMDIVLKSIIRGVVFDYITKPWDKDVLFRKIYQISHIKEQFISKDIIIKLNQINSFPIGEENYSKLSKLLENGNSLEDIIDISKNDVFLSTKVIKLINSAFYSENKIGSVTRALHIMGIKGIKDIISYSSLETIESLPSFQSKRLLVYNKLINETNERFREFYELYYKKSIPDDLELMGLVPFIGKLIFLYLYPEKYMDVYNIMMEDKNISFEEAQKKCNCSDYDYINLGSYLLSLWNFPDLYINTIKNLLSPYSVPEDLKELIAILTVSKEYSKKSIRKSNSNLIGYKKEEIINRIEDLVSNYKRSL